MTTKPFFNFELGLNAGDELDSNTPEEVLSPILTHNDDIDENIYGDDHEKKYFENGVAIPIYHQ